MSSIHTRILSIVVVLSACRDPSPLEPSIEPSAASVADGRLTPKPGSATDPPDRHSSAVVPVERPGPLEIAWGDQLRKPSGIRRWPNGDMAMEPYSIGWSATTNEFLFCAEDGGACCDRCWFLRPEHEAELVEVGEECGGFVPGKVEARRRIWRFDKLMSRLEAGAFAVEDGDWAWGAEVVFVAQELRGDVDRQQRPRRTVRVGARLRAGEAPIAWLEHIDNCYGDGPEAECMPVHIDAIAVAPDGRHVAVLAHSYEGEYSDEYMVRIVDATRAAREAHVHAGLTHMHAGQLDLAAQRFERAAEIDPQDWKGPYNLACAHALAGRLGAARAALEEALRRGQEPVRMKMATDVDLDGVRDEPWFGKL